MRRPSLPTNKHQQPKLSSMLKMRFRSPCSRQFNCESDLLSLQGIKRQRRSRLRLTRFSVRSLSTNAMQPSVERLQPEAVKQENDKAEAAKKAEMRRSEVC